MRGSCDWSQESTWASFVWCRWCRTWVVSPSNIEVLSAKNSPAIFLSCDLFCGLWPMRVSVLNRNFDYIFHTVRRYGIWRPVIHDSENALCRHARMQRIIRLKHPRCRLIPLHTFYCLISASPSFHCSPTQSSRGSSLLSTQRLSRCLANFPTWDTP